MNSPLSRKIRLYYSLTKPHVTYGNVLTVASGFLLAAAYVRQFQLGLFVATILGTTLVIASACVLNNYLDQDIDQLMERTKSRVVASGEVPGFNAVVFSTVLCSLGIATLALWTNWLVVVIGAIGFVTYVWLYGALSKRRSIHGTLVGSISGAMPILAGYCAVSGRIDSAAVFVFLMLFFWQFPEFFSIAIYRRKEYAAANIPVISVVKGVRATKLRIFVYTILFVISSVMVFIYGYTGITYLIIMSVLGLYWINLGYKGLHVASSDKWARKMFHWSLIMLVILSIMLPLGVILP